MPIYLFEVVDDNVSDGWKIKIGENGEVTLWPELFYRENFLENFSDYETKERELFKKLWNEIEI